MEESTTYSFGDHIQNFIVGVDAIANALPSYIVATHMLLGHSTKRIRKLADEVGAVHESEDKRSFSVEVPSSHSATLTSLHRDYERFDALRTLIPRTAIVSLISTYDALLGNLIRGIFHTHPESLNASERNITISELMQFESIDDAREAVIEKEIEAVLRRSHADQFAWLSKRLDIPLTKGLECWGRFIEVTERRNLFVHTDGIVSSQYLSCCRAHHAPLDPSIKVGGKITVDPEYFRAAYRAVFEVGVKLGHVMWCKLVPDEIDAAESFLINTGVNLVTDEEYKLAMALFDFPFLLPARRSESSRLILLINKAMTLKWMNDEKGCRAILESIDWSPLSAKFAWAKAVLEDRFADAARMMLEMGRNGEISQANYHSWPLLKKFRRTTQFTEAYKSVFDEEYVESAQIVDATASLSDPDRSEDSAR